MKTPVELEKCFSALGAVFLTPAAVIAQRLTSLRALVFDWDGVFNAGEKGGADPSTFTEADSMGTNLLRYALWRRQGQMPITAIISGMDNPTAQQFAKREHFQVVYSSATDKSQAIAQLCVRYDLKTHEIGCVFDDVNDLSMAAVCGLRFLVRRDASPLLQDHVARRQLVDYLSAGSSGHYVVREVAELLLGLMGVFDAVTDSRVSVDEDYKNYFAARQAVHTELLTLGAA